MVASRDGVALISIPPNGTRRDADHLAPEKRCAEVAHVRNQSGNVRSVSCWLAVGLTPASLISERPDAHA
jgi:hypothetical protein